MVLDPRIGERETLVEDGAHRLFGFDQCLLRWDVGALSPCLIREFLILHDLRRVDERGLPKMKETRGVEPTRDARITPPTNTEHVMFTPSFIRVLPSMRST